MHIGVIMDGNRRYAKQNLVQIILGHRKGVLSLENLIELCPKYNIDTVTVYAFSTENFVNRTQEAVDSLVDSTKEGTKVLLQLCLNYGGRSEIVEAVQKAVNSGEKEFTEEIISKYLYSCLEPDLIIRPGGEFRLSNFLTWQSAYSELFFTDTLWPDFGEADLVKALDFYNSRQRRFGK